MPKRIGYLYEQVASPDNCILAVREMARSKPKIRRAQYMKRNAEEFGKRISEQLITGTWTPRPYNTKTIKDGFGLKERHIKIPCLWDQVVHHAQMQITAPYIERRNYFYNCGSIPEAGQIRATRAVKRWLAGKKIIKYGQSLDVRHFFENCHADIVMKALGRIFKDKRFLALHRLVLKSMGDTLAIGFNVSHWYANLVLSYVDNQIKQRIIPDCKYVRYMDDMLLLHNNKRKLHKAREEIRKLLEDMGLMLKPNWQVYRINDRGITFLSYRFFHGYTIMRKRLMYRISRICRRAATHRNITFHEAASVISYLGILKHCNSYNFRKKYVYPYVRIKKYKGVIRDETRRIHKLSSGVRSCPSIG